MALFSRVFRQLFGCFLGTSETPLKAQQCAAQELPEASVVKAGENEAFEFKAKNKKRRRRRCQVKESEMDEGGGHIDMAEKKREAISLEKVKDRGHVPQKNIAAAEPTPLLMEVKPLVILVSPPERPFFLKPLEGDLPVPPSVSNALPAPAARFRPLPPVTKPPVFPLTPLDPAPEEVSPPCSPSRVSPPKPLAVPPHPTSAPDGLFLLRLCPPKQLEVAPSSTPASDEAANQHSSSIEVCPPCPVEPLMLVDIEDEETEYVPYTGKTYQACDLRKSESPRLPEAERKPRRIVAWLESKSEGLEEVCPGEVLEVQAFEEAGDDPDQLGDSKAVKGHLSDSSQRKGQLDENMMRLFCVSSPQDPKNDEVKVQEKAKTERKLPLFRLTFTDWKDKKKEEKKKCQEQHRERQLLLGRYRNDPKLKHLWINKHNLHNSFSG